MQCHIAKNKHYKEPNSVDITVSLLKLFNIQSSVICIESNYYPIRLFTDLQLEPLKKIPLELLEPSIIETWILTLLDYA